MTESPQTFNHAAFSKWLIDYEFGVYKDIKKFIQFELENFSSWESDVVTRSEKLKEEQDVLLKKSENQVLSEYEKYILAMDECDLLNAKDEDMISFQEDVLEMLVVKLYAKTEYLLKYIFTMAEDKNRSGKVELGSNIREWKDNFVSKLSIDLEKICNYQTLNTVRIINNNIKHCNGNYSSDTAKAIVNSSARYVLSYFFSNDLCTEIVSKTDEEFLKYSKKYSGHVKISKNDIYDFHTKLCDFFTHLLSQI